MSKWNKQYWFDLGERVGATFVGALITALTVAGTTPVDWTDKQVVWTILGLPTLIALLKGLAVNLGTGDTPTASLVKVTSNGEPNPVNELGRVTPATVIVVCLVVFLVLFLLAVIFPGLGGR